MTESDVNRFAIRYGLWNNTQTIVTLSTPYRSDHLRVLDILRSKIVTILPDSTVVRYNMSLTSDMRRRLLETRKHYVHGIIH